jgi:hypothetical protein
MVSSYGVADRVNECIKQGNTFDYCNTHVKWGLYGRIYYWIYFRIYDSCIYSWW